MRLLVAMSAGLMAGLFTGFLGGGPLAVIGCAFLSVVIVWWRYVPRVHEREPFRCQPTEDEIRLAVHRGFKASAQRVAAKTPQCVHCHRMMYQILEREWICLSCDKLCERCADDPVLPGHHMCLDCIMKEGLMD